MFGIVTQTEAIDVIAIQKEYDVHAGGLSADWKPTIIFSMEMSPISHKHVSIHLLFCFPVALDYALSQAFLVF